MLNLITGGAGTGKSREMMSRIADAVSQGRKVYAVVPDQFNFEYNRLLYNFMGMKSFNRMEVVSFSRLASYIFINHGGLKGKYADDTVKTIIMSRALSKLKEQKSLNFYANQAERQGFVNDALEFVKTFVTNGITPEALISAKPHLSENMQDKTGDIALICEEYFRLLGKQGYKDGESDILTASAKAAEHGFFSGTDVFIDEFKSFTPDEYEMLRVMIEDCDSCTVCITTEDERPAEYTVFESADRTFSKLTYYAKECRTQINRITLTEYHRFAAEELEFLSRNILRHNREKYSGECEAVKVYTAADPYSEADFVCAEIKHLVMENGYSYSDIAVTARQKETYSSALDAAFRRSGIPFYTDEKISVSHKAPVIFIKTALKIISSRRISTEDILRYIKTGCLALDEDSIGTLEDYCYMWSVDGDMWLEPFVSDGENSPEETRQKIIAPLLKLKKDCEGKNAAEICLALTDFLTLTGIREHLTETMSETADDDSGILMIRRELKQLWETLCRLLETMYRTLGEAEISLAEFTDIFTSAASGITLSSPPRTLDSVHFTAAHTARFSNPKVLFVIGANEGIFPFSAKSSSLLTDRDISELKKGGIELSGSVPEKTADERFVVYNTLSSPSERLYISYPCAEVSGKPLYPSSAVKQTLEIFENSDISLNAEKLGLLYFCTCEKTAYYQYVQSFRRRSHNIRSIKKALESFDPLNKERFRYLDSLKKQYVHNLSPETSEKLFGRNITLSASRFEDYRNCPFMFFCKMGLKIYPRSKIQYDPRSRGNIVHYCLSEVIKQFGSDIIRANRTDISCAVEKALDDYYAGEQIGGSYGKSARFNAAYKRLKSTVMGLVMRIKEEFANSDFRPVEFEYELSHKPTAAEPPMTILSDGDHPYKIFFIGTVDRIDACEKDGQNYIRVIDYKTGRKVFELKDLLDGLNMQMLLYLFAVTDIDVPANSGAYHASKPAGILYMPARDPSLTLSRDADESEIRKAVCNALRMNGLLLNDDNFKIIKAMDKSVNTDEFEGRTRKADFLPVTMKNATKAMPFVTINDSGTVTEDEFGLIKDFCTGMIRQTASSIKQGDFRAEPLARNIGGQTAPCCYCDYKSVCGNYPELIVKKTPLSEMGSEYAEQEILQRYPDNDSNDESKGDE
ncbi:MAG: exodeoxyribonuclease V subunit gamma [Oscillospiraceae bacterium]|nr:exodeoxyribonuclease V subunit gamma [Oscillospiraceae bacterium]